MRRWISILLLVFMPLQFSWAAVASYCGHESGAQTRHIGHHQHEHHAQADAKNEPAKTEPAKTKAGAALDVADCHFHGQCAAAMQSFSGLPVILGATPRADAVALDALAPVLSRPERPQWARHA